MKRNILMYDFEVFSKANWWMVVIINYESKEKTIILNDKKQLEEFYKSHMNDIWVGYNSRMYDQYILKGILLGKDPCKINDDIIINNKHGYQVLRNAKSIKLNNFDVSTGFHSLKQLEAFMGSMIKESSIDFNLDRPLTQEEIEETIKYCIHDVEETIKVFEYRREEFDSQLGVIEAFDLSMEMFNKTKAQLAADVLGAVKQESIDDEFNFTFPNTMKLDKYKYVYEWYLNPRNWTYSRKLVTDICGVEHTFAFGGVHGALTNYKAEGIILCCDVASLYPSIMIEYGFTSRNITSPNKYKELRDTRLELKRNKDPRQKPYKILLNGTYGASKDRNNALFDPLMANNVCITGQLLLLDLIEKLEPHMKLLQSNTDGIYMLVENMNKVELIKNIAKEWEQRTRLELEWDIYNKIYQRDVNNYIIIDDKGNFKSKGCVKKKNSIDNDLPIITKAIIEYCVNGTSIEDTINNCNELIQFQKVVKISSLYLYALYGKEKLKEKVLRVFASKDEEAKGVFKVKGKDKIEKLANTPDKCFINNEDIVGVEVPENLDKQYYIDLAKETLSDFLGENETKVPINYDEIVQKLISLNLPTWYDVLEYLKLNKSKLTNKKLTDYILIDKFKKYGVSKNLIVFMDYFKILYNKKNVTMKTLEKKITDVNVLNIIKIHSDFDDSKLKFNNLDSKNALLKIFDYLNYDDVNSVIKINKEFEMYDDVTLTDGTFKINRLYVMNVNQTKNPSIIAYCINNGKIQMLKIEKELFKILEIRPNDLIEVSSFKAKPYIKVIGKDKNGVNVLSEDTSKYEWWIEQYEILARDYNKNSQLIVESENNNM